jgi:hypothetical protein
MTLNVVVGDASPNIPGASAVQVIGIVVISRTCHNARGGPRGGSRPKLVSNACAVPRLRRCQCMNPGIDQAPADVGVDGASQPLMVPAQPSAPIDDSRRVCDRADIFASRRGAGQSSLHSTR